MKILTKKITIFFLFVGLLILLPSTVFADTLTGIVAQSQASDQARDKVYAVSGDSFFAYGEGCGTEGCQITEQPNGSAPTGWKNLNFNSAAWGDTMDTFAGPPTSDAANEWWCQTFPSNCHPLQDLSGTDILQITGPNGFRDRETYLFTKPYTISPPVGYRTTRVILDIWSDNNSWVYINGNLVTTGGLNHTTTTTLSQETLSIDMSELAMAGGFDTDTITKQLAIQVSNDWQGPTNPIGISYKITAEYEPYLPKTCSVTPAASSVVSGNTVGVYLYGNAKYYPSDSVRLWVEQQDGIRITNTISPSATEVVSGGKYYYNFPGSTCQTGGNINDCSPPTTYVNLPIGNYYFHCDLPTSPGKCSGNPFCTYEGGTIDCTGWRSCSSNDNATLSIVPAPPNITSLQVNNASSGQTGEFSGPYGITGLQSTQGGANWLNPIVITVNATQGSASIKQRYVAFYNKTGGLVTTSSTFLSTIQGRLNSSRNAGFLLAYGSGIKSGETNQYYVWDPSVTVSDKWVNITDRSTLGYNICSATCSTQTLLYTAYPISAGSWKILFDKNFGSKSMHTAVYVVDNNNLSAFSSDITPTQ